MLSKWVGRGNLWDTLQLAPEEVGNEEWSISDLEARAHRVLLEKVRDPLMHWPSRLSGWLDLLPAARTHSTTTQPVPFSGVSWTTSLIRHGWTPSAFAGRETKRSADMLLVTALRWTAETLLRVRCDAVRLFPDADAGCIDQLNAIQNLLGSDLMERAASIAPGRQELVAMRREGAPWGAVADVAEQLLVLNGPVEALTTQLLLPDDEIRWRLFHLAVLGTLLTTLRKSGCKITSLRPLSAKSDGPAFEVLDPHGTTWELWFEASGIWRRRSKRAPYREATAGIPGIERTLAADVLLIAGEDSALIFECKYSNSREFVGRAGYYQAVTYAAEAKSRLVDRVTSVAVGPEGIVVQPSLVETIVGRVGVTPPSGVGEIVSSVMALRLVQDVA